MKQLKFNPDRKERKRKRILQREYIEKKINGHGGAYKGQDNGRIIATYMGNKNKIQLIFINIHLWFIWRFK